MAIDRNVQPLDDTHVKITKEYLKELQRSEAELCALHNGGVDNWEWYSDSLRDAGLFDDEDDEDFDDEEDDAENKSGPAGS